MPDCSFCGTAELKEYPLCHSCGAIRYPVAGLGNTGLSLPAVEISCSMIATYIF
jgi:hypothetical protein